MLEHEAGAGHIYERLGSILRTLMFVGMGIVGVGTVISFVRHGELMVEATKLDDLLSGLGHGESSAIISLGFMVLLAAPAAGLAYLTVAFYRAGNRMYSLFAAIVLLIIVGSIALGRKA